MHRLRLTHISNHRPLLSSLSSASTVSRRVDLAAIRALLTSGDPLNNVPPAIADKVGINLHLTANHPLNIVKRKVEDYCNHYAAANSQSLFTLYDNECPVADVKSCFDDLLVPKDHCSRSRSDTYYVTNSLVALTAFVSLIFSRF